ncbi:MAG: D-alanyl-D-alanine carboxypeptidase [Oscillospiraceae bacterium]|nr:D-alanyl-D-alanine carboxypeptidase [Oscillospiraceae bacterium]
MKKALAVFVITLTLCGVAHAAQLDINAPSVVLMEKETGTVLFARDEHTRREPASVTKIMTILLTMEAIDSGTLSYDSVVTTSAHASSMGGSQIWLREHEQMTVEEMLKAVCVVSANDCAVALGEHLAGSEEAFVERMNRRAKELGMNDTVFQNATGLPAVGHVTSAYDIALMSRELILNHPDIRRFTTIWMDSLRGGTSVLVNTNKLLRTFDGATGLKTGSTGAARYCLSATAERDGMELIAVILKGETSAKRFQDAKTLLSYGFSNYALRSVEPDTPLPGIPVEMGTVESVEVEPDGSSLLLLDKNKAASLRQEVELEESLKAPVEKGTRVGTLTAYAGDELLAEIPLLTAYDVPRVTYGQMFFRVLRMAFLDE